jgi:hypothetical protein
VHWGPLPAQPLKGIKLHMSIKLIVLVLPTNQCLSIKKHAIHNMHRLTWGPMLMPMMLLRRPWLI